MKKILIYILAIIIIHSILKYISESLENDNISKLIYYVQYIAIVTIIMGNFSDIINMVKETTTNLIGFMNTGSTNDNKKENFLKNINNTDENEGIIYKHFIGTYLIGPLLVRNPELLKLIVKK